jgi:hypothetical protein
MANFKIRNDKSQVKVRICAVSKRVHGRSILHKAPFFAEPKNILLLGFNQIVKRVVRVNKLLHSLLTHANLIVHLLSYEITARLDGTRK